MRTINYHPISGGFQYWGCTYMHLFFGRVESLLKSKSQVLQLGKAREERSLRVFAN